MGVGLRLKKPGGGDAINSPLIVEILPFNSRSGNHKLCLIKSSMFSPKNKPKPSYLRIKIDNTKE